MIVTKLVCTTCGTIHDVDVFGPYSGKQMRSAISQSPKLVGMFHQVGDYWYLLWPRDEQCVNEGHIMRAMTWRYESVPFASQPLTDESDASESSNS